MSRAIWGIYKFGQFKWGQVSSVAFVNAKNKHSAKGHLLLEIDLDDRTLYLSDSYLTVGTNYYEGQVLDWGSIDTDRSPVEGLGAVGDTNVILANKRMQFMDESTYGEKLSDLLDDYNFDLRPATIKQWFEGLNLVDAVTIFKGGVKIQAFDVDEVELQLVHVSDLDLLIPYHKVNKGDHPQAPDANFGRPIPVSFGDWRSPDIDSYRGPFMPAILTDKNKIRLDFAKGYETKEISVGFPLSYSIRRWVDELEVYMEVINTNFSETTDDEYTYIELLDPLYGNIFIVPPIAGSQNNADDWANAVKPIGDTSTVTLTDPAVDATNDKLSVKFNGLPDLGKIQDWTAANIRIGVKVETITGGAGNAAVVQYYNEGYDDGVTPSYSTAQYITGTGTSFFNIATDKTAHGTAAGQEDRYNAWQWDELGSYEYYIAAQSGFTVEISEVYLQIKNFEIIAPFTVRSRRTRKRQD